MYWNQSDLVEPAHSRFHPRRSLHFAACFSSPTFLLDCTSPTCAFVFPLRAPFFVRRMEARKKGEGRRGRCLQNCISSFLFPPPPFPNPWRPLPPSSSSALRPFCHNSLEGLRNVRGITRHLRLVETLGVLEPCLTHRDIML